MSSPQGPSSIAGPDPALADPTAERPAAGGGPIHPSGLDRPGVPAAFIPAGATDEALDGRRDQAETEATLGLAPHRPRVVRVPRKEGPRVQPDLVGKQE